jgi:transcriptional regulator with XRE-family HTH domain
LVVGTSVATIVSKYAALPNPLVKHVEVKSMSKTFSARLNRLFDTVYPPGRGPHTSAEVIAALKAEGVTMSAPYLSQLRSGNRTNPSATTMAALANFFRIKPAYFTDDEYYEKLDKELTWLASMRDEGVRRIAARTVGLSAEAQQDIVLKVDELRRREHLDD